ncbi:hypothetical protein D3C78_852440 [compost metagenome]
MHVHHMGVLAHLLGDPAGQGADFHDVLAGNAELHRIAHWRAVLQAADTGAHAGEVLGQALDQPLAHLLAGLQVLRQHYELGEAGGRQLLVQRQVEARRAGADVGHVVVDAGMLGKQLLQALGLLGGGLQRIALGQLEVDQQLQARRRREELLRHHAEQQHRADERQQGQGDHRLAIAYAPLHQTPEALVERRRIRIVALVAAAMLLRMPPGQVGQQLVAEIGHEDHGGDPRHQQGDGHHLEQRAGVFAGAGLRGGDRQEAGGRHQRAGEHGERRAGPGETGRLEAVVALLHLHRHHLHRDDRVVHQQAQRQHQGAEGNLVQADAEVVHAGEGHRQHQRNRQRHHQAGTQAEGEEADQQHDDQRLRQHPDEIPHAFTHGGGLVGHLAQLHAGRQGFLQTPEFAVQRLAEDENVAARLHRHGDADGILAHEAHARRRRVVEATVHVGHVADAEGAVADADGEPADVVDRVEAPGNPQLHAVAVSLEEASSGDRVLLLQRLLHRGQRHAEGGQLGIRQVDPDLLVLQADQFDLADVLDALQLQLQTVGVVLQHRVVETLAGQRIDIAEGGAELIVEERPYHALRQGEADIADLLANLVPELGNIL